MGTSKIPHYSRDYGRRQQDLLAEKTGQRYCMPGTHYAPSSEVEPYYDSRGNRKYNCKACKAKRKAQIKLNRSKTTKEK